jgi:hypothetical protein
MPKQPKLPLWQLLAKSQKLPIGSESVQVHLNVQVTMANYYGYTNYGHHSGNVHLVQNLGSLKGTTDGKEASVAFHRLMERITTSDLPAEHKNELLENLDALAGQVVLEKKCRKGGLVKSGWKFVTDNVQTVKGIAEALDHFRTVVGPLLGMS